MNISKRNTGMKNTGKIMNAEEYEAYQGQLKTKSNAQLSNAMQNQNKFNRNYIGPDDDYWYEKKK